MRVAIYGAGAMGTVLGAYITKAGYQIDLINRNKDHIKGLKENGAQIVGKIEFTQQVNALLPEEMTGKYDIILLMTKQRFNEDIVQFLQPFLNEQGIICTMQNGIPEPLIASIIGDDKVVGSAMSWGATFKGHGISELTSEATRDTLTFSIGKYGNVNDELFNYIVTLLETMGNVTIEENFIGARFAKLLINAAYSGISVVTGATFGEINANKKAKRLALKVIKECIEVAKVSNIIIEPIQGKDVVKLIDYNNIFKKQLSLFILPIAMKKHKNIKSSMLRDLERGYKTEVDAINGVVSNYGKKANVPTPVNDKIIDIVRQIEDNKLSPQLDNINLF